MTRVFADTSFYIGLLHAKDVLHGRCRDFDLGYSGQYLTSEFILIELGNWLASAHDRAAFVEFNRLLRANPRTILLPASSQWLADGLALYAERLDKQWSVIDCISFQMMRQQHLTDALTADHHYVQAGFNAVLRGAND